RRATAAIPLARQRPRTGERDGADSHPGWERNHRTGGSPPTYRHGYPSGTRSRPTSRADIGRGGKNPYPSDPRTLRMEPFARGGSPRHRPHQPVAQAERVPDRRGFGQPIVGAESPFYSSSH